MMDTYLDNSRKASCTGCSACVQVCGKGAMHMEYDAEGFAYPVIDREKCVNCGLCRAACPMTKDLLYPKVERVTGGPRGTRKEHVRRCIHRSRQSLVYGKLLCRIRRRSDGKTDN